MEEIYKEIINNLSNHWLESALVSVTFCLYACEAYFSFDKEQRKSMKKSLESSIGSNYHKN